MTSVEIQQDVLDPTLALIEASRVGNLEEVKHSLSCGAKTDTKTESGWTPVSYASLGGYLEIVQFLTEKSAEASVHQKQTKKQENPENTPLHWACYGGHDQIVTYLLDSGCDIEQPDPNGNRPLHLAAGGGHHKVIEVLLARSADTKARNIYSNTPLDLCTDVYLIKLLKEAESQVACTECKKALQGASCLCQHCHRFFCHAEACSTLTEVPGTGSKMRQKKRRCEECTRSVLLAEVELRQVLEVQTQAISLDIQSTEPVEQPVEETEAVAEENVDEAVAPDEGESEAKGEDPSPEVEEQEPVKPPEAQDNVKAIGEALEKRQVKVEEVEVLFHAIEKVRELQGDETLTSEADKLYQRYIADITLAKEIKALKAQSPISLHSQIHPLKRAIVAAEKNDVPAALIEYANRMIWIAESEYVLMGIKQHFIGIESASDELKPQMKKLAAAVARCESRGGSGAVIEDCKDILHRFTSELEFYGALQAPVENSGEYKCSNGRIATSLLQAIEFQLEQLNQTLESVREAEYIPAEKIEEAEALQKQLKKQFKDENRRAEERKKLEEEAAQKAARKSKKKK